MIDIRNQITETENMLGTLHEMPTGSRVRKGNFTSTSPGTGLCPVSARLLLN